MMCLFHAINKNPGDQTFSQLRAAMKSYKTFEIFGYHLAAELNVLKSPSYDAMPKKIVGTAK